jgi:hypothetical protein
MEDISNTDSGARCHSLEPTPTVEKNATLNEYTCTPCGISFKSSAIARVHRRRVHACELHFTYIDGKELNMIAW